MIQVRALVGEEHRTFVLVEAPEHPGRHHDTSW